MKRHFCNEAPLEYVDKAENVCGAGFTSRYLIYSVTPTQRHVKGGRTTMHV